MTTSKQNILAIILDSISEAKQLYRSTSDQEERRSFMEQEIRLLEVAISLIQMDE